MFDHNTVTALRFLGHLEIPLLAFDISVLEGVPAFSSCINIVASAYFAPASSGMPIKDSTYVPNISSEIYIISYYMD
jgi:hypothetical protein